MIVCGASDCVASPDPGSTVNRAPGITGVNRRGLPGPDNIRPAVRDDDRAIDPVPVGVGMSSMINSTESIKLRSAPEPPLHGSASAGDACHGIARPSSDGYRTRLIIREMINNVPW